MNASLFCSSRGPLRRDAASLFFQWESLGQWFMFDVADNMVSMCPICCTSACEGTRMQTLRMLDDRVSFIDCSEPAIIYQRLATIGPSSVGNLISCPGVIVEYLCP